MRSKFLASTLAIVLGLATSVVSAIGFSDVVSAQTVEEKKKEFDQLLQQGDKQYKMGKFKLALQSWQQALNLDHATKDRIAEAKVFSRLGIVYSSLEDYPKAIDYQQRSLAIARELKNRQGENAAFYNLGDIYLSLGNYLKSIEYQENLALLN